MSASGTIIWALAPLAAGIVLQLIAARLLSSRAKGVLALVTSLPSLAAVIAAFPQVHASGAIDWNAMPWDGPLALVFHVDALSLMFAAMGTVLGAIVLLYSIGYMAHNRGATRFYALMLTFIAGMVGLVYSANLFAVYLCWELMGLCSFSLVGFWYQKKESVAGARKVLLMTHLAGYGLLAAILLIYMRTGSALWTAPGVAQAFTGGVYSLMLVALLAKSVQFPLHTWIPEAMNAPTPVSALLHAACYVKAGVYLAARMHCFSQWPANWGLTMMWLGTVTMVVGVAYAMVQHDLKRMLAFHTVSQIGYIITGIGLGTPLAIAAGLLHCLNHSLFKGGLFLAAGSVQHATGTRDMNELGGLARRMPRTTVTWLISVGSMMGVPFMSGFASKWLLYTAALQAGQVVPALVAWVVSVGTVFSCVKATSSVFLGPTTEKTSDAHEAPASMSWALALFAAGSLTLGIAPQLAINYVINPILPLFGLGTVQVSWFGLTPSNGAWWTTGGLMLGIFAALVGTVLYAFAGLSRARGLAVPSAVMVAGAAGGGGVGVFTGGEPIPGTGRLPASEFSVILKRHWAPFYSAVNVDNFYMSVWSALQMIAAAAGNAIAWASRRAIAWTVAGAVALFAVLAIVAPSGLPRMQATQSAGILMLACLVAGAALWIAAIETQGTFRQLGLLMLASIAGVAALGIDNSFARLALIETASIAVLAAIWFAAARRAAWIYGAVVVVSAACLLSGQIAMHAGASAVAIALLLTGFLVKLGLAPAMLWLPSVAESTPAPVMGTLIAVVDIAAFGELAVTAQEYPGILAPKMLWVGLALASALVASLLMLTEKNVKRMLALSSIEDMGFLLLGLAAASEIGMRGALIGAASHAMAKALLFASISAPEADGALTESARGLASRYPVSAAGFMAGMLAMLGVPPMLGFAGRWRLYQSAAGMNNWLLAAFVAASMMSLIAYVLCLTRVWWGSAESESAPRTSEPPLLRLAIVVLMAVLVLAGLWPDGFLALAGRIS
ncbi:MAG TPA: proton-conducting transporter membrane subunit [Terracidiphilus sp.]